jgi:hypothetical protein
MSDERYSTPDRDAPTIYQIRLAGHLGQRWWNWFEGFVIMLEANGETLLTGTVVDQAALHGALKKVRDLGLPLISLSSLTSDHAVE